MASDTSNLDAVLSFAAGASGGFAAFTGAMELFGSESEEVQEAQKKLQAAIAITTGVQAIAKRSTKTICNHVGYFPATNGCIEQSASL
ncbi:MAG: hypothetical protein ACLU99_15050 [Alphaproteobacteria bacterium]